MEGKKKSYSIKPEKKFYRIIFLTFLVLMIILIYFQTFIVLTAPFFLYMGIFLIPLSFILTSMLFSLDFLILISINVAIALMELFMRLSTMTIISKGRNLQRNMKGSSILTIILLNFRSSS